MKSVLTIVLCFAMAFTTCSPAWVSTVTTILSVAAPALINILQIVAIAGGKPFDPNLATKINTDAATLKQLAADYAAASAAAKPGACSQLLAGIGMYSADVQLIINVAQVSNPVTQQKITLLTELVVGTVEAIAAVIPACSATAPTGPRVSQKFSVKNFVNDYNTELVKTTGNTVVDDLTPKLKLKR
jgi:D-alanyl-D-alanine carboxypeptidase